MSGPTLNLEAIREAEWPATVEDIPKAKDMSLYRALLTPDGKGEFFKAACSQELIRRHMRGIHIHTGINHQLESGEHCCGCWIIVRVGNRVEADGINAECGECGYIVRLTDLLNQPTTTP